MCYGDQATTATLGLIATRDRKLGALTIGHSLKKGMQVRQPDFIATGPEPRPIGTVVDVCMNGVGLAWIEFGQGVRGLRGMVADAEGLRMLNFNALFPVQWTVAMLACWMWTLPFPRAIRQVRLTESTDLHSYVKIYVSDWICSPEPMDKTSIFNTSYLLEDGK